MPNPRRLCIFCPNTANSGEHLWSEWMHPLLGEEVDAYRVDEKGVIREAGNAYQIGTRVNHRRGERLISLAPKVVCKKCNETWMSTLEQEARPILEPLLRGESHKLTTDAQAMLTRWLTLKLMVLDAHVAQTFTAGERQAFFDGRETPDNLTLLIFDPGRPLHAQYRASAFVFSKSDPAPIDNDIGNTHTCTWFVGRLGVFASYNRGGMTIKPPNHVRCRMTRIWPPRDKAVAWPQPRSLERADFSTLKWLFRDTAAKNSIRLMVTRTQVKLRVVTTQPDDSIFSMQKPGPFIVGAELVDLTCGSCEAILVLGASNETLRDSFVVPHRLCLECTSCHSINQVFVRVLEA
jgi:hypothetical protein